MAIGLKHDGATKVLELRDGVDGLSYPQSPNSIAYHDGNSTEAQRAALLALMAIPIKYLKWNGSAVSEMSQAEKDAVDAAEAAALVAAAKTAAKDLYDALDSMGRVIRALGKLNVDEINILRQWITDFKAQTALATNLANFQTRVAALPNVPNRTYAQAKTAIGDLVDGE